MKEVYVVNCCRTAIGSFGGSLKDTPAAEMGAVVIKEALNRAGVKPENVDEVMILPQIRGCENREFLGLISRLMDIRHRMHPFITSGV